MFWNVKPTQTQFFTISTVGGISDISVCNNSRDGKLQCYKKYLKSYGSVHFLNLVKCVRTSFNFRKTRYLKYLICLIDLFIAQLVDGKP